MFDTLLELFVFDVQNSLQRFAPELTLCVTVVAMLLVRLFNLDRHVPSYWVALGGTLISFFFAFTDFNMLKMESFDLAQQTIFTGLLVFDGFTIFFRLFLLLFLILVIALTVLSGIPDNEDGADFYVLLLGSTIGMMLMSSANHMLILFLGIEMASVPGYVMVGFLKGRKKSSEAAFKYVVYGAGAAGVMLYGISLLTGLLGTADMVEIASRMNAVFAGSESVGMGDATARTVILALVMILAGFAFKLSIVPFHFWCPDAFEGAAAEIGGFLSVASKAAAFALLARFCVAFSTGQADNLKEFYMYVGIGIGAIAALSATFGNLAAYAQTNVKRLLAYSTIAHAGYMLMAISALVVVLNEPAGDLFARLDADGDGVLTRQIAEQRYQYDVPELYRSDIAIIFDQLGKNSITQAEFVEQAKDPAVVHTLHRGLGAQALEGLLYYLAVYMFMNLGAFAIVALIRNHIFSEELEDYKGLVHQTPALCICMLICMFSLVGLPPLGGFVGKFMIFATLFEAGAVHWSMWAILLIGGVNTVFSLVYYIRVLKVMFLAERPADARPALIPFRSAPSMYCVMVTVPVLALGIFVEQLSYTARQVASILF